MKRITNLLSIALLLIGSAWIGCSPNSEDVPPLSVPYQLSYGDSILYLKTSAGDYIVYPAVNKEGTYSAFPEGIEIDNLTGAINLSKSETGLRYKITHTAPDRTITTARIVLSGISFTDHYFNLSTGDSLAIPVYNATTSGTLPVAGSSFDEGNNANSGGCAVRTDNGKINLAQCVRNSIFGFTPQNDTRKEFDIYYRLNDGSGKTLNKLRVRLYYYKTMADVAPDLIQTLNDRQSGGVFLRGQVAGIITEQAAKPRPPCVIIIAN